MKGKNGKHPTVSNHENTAKGNAQMPESGEGAEDDFHFDDNDDDEEPNDLSGAAEVQEEPKRGDLWEPPRWQKSQNKSAIKTESLEARAFTTNPVVIESD